MDLIKENIIRKATELGFNGIGFSRAGALAEEKKKLARWLEAGFHGKMSYMENYRDLRTDPTLLHPGTRTVISLSYNYFPAHGQNPQAPVLSKYAYGKDYHKVLKKKLRVLSGFLQNYSEEPLHSRAFTDSAPILERQWAQRSGLGWAGKHTLLIHPKKGSYFFLAEILTELEITPDQPIKDYCGTCTRCIDACPTDAILPEGYILDGSKCISYLTIELKDSEIPNDFEGKMADQIFGCDICQDVCPWNRFSSPHTEPEFIPNPEILHMSREDWANLTRESFDRLFEGSAVKRTGYSGLKRNIRFLDKK